MDSRDWAIKTSHVLKQWNYFRTAKKYGRSYDAYLSQFELEIVLIAVVEAMVSELAEGGNLRIAKLGRLYVEEVPARELKSNLDGQVYEVDAKKVVRFKPSSYLLKRINKQVSDD